jgi:glutamate racemase
MADARPVGVFDSGLGGLTVVRELLQKLPGESLVYLGDTARVPYGTKSSDTVVRYSLSCARFLLRHDVKMIMVACNTASAAALEALETRLTVPVLGAVGPGARAAATHSRGGHIGVFGTSGTVRSEAYVRAIRALRPDAAVAAVACPLLVPLAEEGWIEGDVPRLVIRRYMDELCALDPAIDTLVLGCTHYPVLRAPIAAVASEVLGREVAVVDSATAMASDAQARLGEMGLLGESGAPGGARFFFTDRAQTREVGRRFLGAPLGSVEETDLDPS